MKKKLLSVVLCVATVAVMFAGCGASKDDTGASANSTEKHSSGSKTYIIATDTTFAPFEFTNSNGKFVGIDVDILSAVAKDQGFKYKLNSLGFDAALAALESKQADGMIAGMSVTDERKKTYDFSDTYYDADVTMAVAKDSDIKTYDDLKGKKVAVKTGTNGSIYAKSIKDKYGFDLVEFKDSPTMYQDVALGNTVACFEDYPVMAYNIKQGAAMKIPDGVNAAGSSYAFAVLKGENKELMDMFNKGLADIKADGTYQKIIDSYTK